MTPDELIDRVRAVHDRCRDYALAAANEFRDLGESLFAEIYESRSRDIEHQRDRHIRVIRCREPSPLPCATCGQTPVVVTSSEGTPDATMLACACEGGPR